MASRFAGLDKSIVVSTRHFLLYPLFWEVPYKIITVTTSKFELHLIFEWFF